jgi:hypothetical protein
MDSQEIAIGASSISGWSPTSMNTHMTAHTR